MQKYFAFLAVCFFISFTGYADDLPLVDPADAGFKSEGLKKLKAHFNAHVDEGKLAGYTALVARRGKIAHFGAYGMQDSAAGKPMDRDSIFRIYSMTKPITGVALLMLYEEGKFKLDDPISKHLPGYENQRVFSGLDENGNVTTVPAEREATVLDLMRHTAGQTYGVFSDTPVDRMYLDTGIMNGLFVYDEEAAKLRGETPSLQNFAKGIGELPLLYQPGKAWVYSVAVDVQGALVEKLSGMPFDVFLEERIFKPLGMKDTGFYLKPEWKDRFVEFYALDQEKKLIPYRGESYSTFEDKPLVPSGGGGLLSTTADYWRFAQMLANDGELNGVRLLKRETVDMMHRDQLPADLGGIAGGKQGLGFGLNVAIVKDVTKNGGKTSKGEYFWGGMANTLFWVDPTKDVVAIFMTNILPSGVYTLRADMREHVYDALK